jgi:hypothetical protein
MKNLFLFMFFVFLLSVSIHAQKYEPVTVRAGMRVLDCFPFKERYRFPEFITGRIQFKTGIYSEAKLNYNLLNSEMEYIKNRDTLAIANSKNISYIAVAQDTFYYDRGYLEQISGGAVKVALKQYIRLKETVHKDSYGTSSSGSATTTYGSLPSQGNYYKLVANEDLVFQRTLEYYISDSSGGFVPYNKKNVLQLYPQKKDQIKAYLKTNKVDFDSRDDLIRLAGFLKDLL